MTTTQTEVTVNIKRSRSFGWGWSPDDPILTGSAASIQRQIEAHRRYSGGVYSSTAWFYRGRRIVSTWGYGMLRMGREDTRDFDDPAYDSFLPFRTAEYGCGWFDGFCPEHAEADGTITIRVED